MRKNKQKDDHQDLVDELKMEEMAKLIEERVTKEEAKIKQEEERMSKIMVKGIRSGRDTNFKDDDLVPRDGQVSRGAAIFSKQCMTCHSLSSNSKQSKSLGPALGMVFRRNMGVDPFYRGYTQGIVNSRAFWTENALFTFMESPSAVIPGTRCMAGQKNLSSEMDRADIIRFLKEYKKELAQHMRMQMLSQNERLYNMMERAQKQASERI